MLEALIGTGARELTVIRDPRGAVVHILYGDQRRGIVELTEGNYQYGGTVRGEDRAFSFVVAMPVYTQLLSKIVEFFQGGPEPVLVNHSLEIMKLLEATQQSYDSGETEIVE